MPVQYSGIVDEHHAVRNASGVFDVSHMGEIEIRGPGGAAAGRLRHHQRTPRKLKIGQAQYSGLLYEHGGFVDDILVHKVAGRSLFPVRQRLQPGKGFRAHPRAQPLRRARWNSPATATRRSPFRVRKRAPPCRSSRRVDLAAIQLLLVHRRHGLAARRRASPAPATPAKTASRSTSPRQKPRGSGTRFSTPAQEFGIKPCGLGARNTLRLEAKMALYGHEIDASITPLEADLAWIVKLDKGEFVGRDGAGQAERAGHHAQADRL